MDLGFSPYILLNYYVQPYTDSMDANNMVDEFVTNHAFKLLMPHESLEGIKGEAGPIGLTLSRTSSLLNAINQLNVESNEAQVSRQSPPDDAGLGAMSNNSSSSTPMKQYGEAESGKLKASNIPLITLQIGNYTRNFIYPNDLAAKIYYAKQAMMWEIMESGQKMKIEFKWSHISAIRASYNSLNGADPDVLDIELSQPPHFFIEKIPTPKKHTQWDPCTDFTNGCALYNRRHRVTCESGTLETHYKRLLAQDETLFQLSKKPFPDLGSALHFPNLPERKIINVGDDPEPSGLRSNHIFMMPNFSPTYDNVDTASCMANILPRPLHLRVNAESTFHQTWRASSSPGYPPFVGNGDHTIGCFKPDDSNMQQGSMQPVLGTMVPNVWKEHKLAPSTSFGPSQYPYPSLIDYTSINGVNPGNNELATKKDAMPLAGDHHPGVVKHQYVLTPPPIFYYHSEFGVGTDNVTRQFEDSSNDVRTALPPSGTIPPRSGTIPPQGAKS